MAKGLAIPVRPGKDGGALISKGEDQEAKILTLALAVGDDENPFQELGISENILFANPDSSAKAFIRRAIEQVINKYASRFKISNRAPIVINQSASGDTSVGFTYKLVGTGADQEFNGKL